jgi:hypothetical protein
MAVFNLLEPRPQNHCGHRYDSLLVVDCGEFSRLNSASQSVHRLMYLTLNFDTKNTFPTNRADLLRRAATILVCLARD